MRVMEKSRSNVKLAFVELRNCRQRGNITVSTYLVEFNVGLISLISNKHLLEMSKLKENFGGESVIWSKRPVLRAISCHVL